MRFSPRSKFSPELFCKFNISIASFKILHVWLTQAEFILKCFEKLIFFFVKMKTQISLKLLSGAANWFWNGFHFFCAAVSRSEIEACS